MKWTTKDGRIMEIKDMDDNHAQNCINMVIKNTSSQNILELIMIGNESRIKNNNFELNGDMAQEFNNNEIDYDGFDDCFVAWWSTEMF